jgi:hypothetical protein
MRTALSSVITERVVLISYGRFGTTYRSSLQGLSLRMGPKSFPEMAVNIYQSTLCNIPEERRSQLIL